MNRDFVKCSDAICHAKCHRAVHKMSFQAIRGVLFLCLSSSCACMALTCPSVPVFPELACERLHALCSDNFLRNLLFSYYHPNYCNSGREPIFQLCHTSLINVKSHQSVLPSVLKAYLPIGKLPCQHHPAACAVTLHQKLGEWKASVK